MGVPAGVKMRTEPHLCTRDKCRNAYNPIPQTFYTVLIGYKIGPQNKKDPIQ